MTTLALESSTPDRRRALMLRESAAAVGCALLVALLVAQLDPGIDLAVPAHGEVLQRVLLNALPALTAFVLLLALTRRLLLSSWVVLLALAGLYAANSAKLGTLETPLLPADLRFLATPGPALRLFSQYLQVDATRWGLIALALGITALLCRERRLNTLAGWRAPALAALALLAGCSLMVGATPWRRVYQSVELGFQPWSLADSVARTGLIGSLLLYHWEIGDGQVPAADRDAAVALLQAHAPKLRAALAATTPAAELPDIVVVQSESLFDPARLREVLSGRWLRDYHRLAGGATSGDLRVPTFAGGTIRTEFEVLTGAPLASLGGVQYPWLELDRDEYPGLARVLDAHGYRSVAIHPNAGAFWNRARAYPALGFDRFIDGASFSPDRIVGLFTADAALTERVLDELADDGPPQFLFAISMENHGPFDWRPGLDAQRLAAIEMPERLDAGGRLWFGNYLYLLDDADHELGRLAKALVQRKRRTLLLFYGDHLPGLAPVYTQLGFDDGRDAKEQPVPWLLLDSADPRPHRLDTHSWMLPALLLQAANIHDGAWFSLLAALTRDHDFDPDEPTSAAGLNALARLQLRGELAPVMHEALGLADSTDAG
ncbi:LTA synthase family protein [Dokdonella soli]|uniref:Sulfatase N-terminal domain-containing protein n=1 Tax=Dokdonella soli TaxID=529810 RepID=A0ABP3TZF9_9GAMM